MIFYFYENNSTMQNFILLKEYNMNQPFLFFIF